MPKNLIIGVVQQPNSLNWKKNFKQAILSINKFSHKKVDVVCFQEAFLSGYHPEVITYYFDEIDWYLERVKEHAYKKKTCVVIPTLNKIGKHCYSAVYVFNSDHGDSVIYKKGLTPSEKLVLKPKSSRRKFKVNGSELGVLICREMEDKPYSYFKKDKMPDLVLWPSYWGWQYKSKWGPIKFSDGKKDKCHQLISKIKKPLVQINMCSTFGKKPNSIDKFGKSVFVNSDNKKIGVGAYGKEDHILVHFDGKKLREVESLN